jgi:hypothetical protein
MLRAVSMPSSNGITVRARWLLLVKQVTSMAAMLYGNLSAQNGALHAALPCPNVCMYVDVQISAVSARTMTTQNRTRALTVKDVERRIFRPEPSSSNP